MEVVDKILGKKVEEKHTCDGCKRKVDNLAVNTKSRKECWRCYDSISFGG